MNITQYALSIPRGVRVIRQWITFRDHIHPLRHPAAWFWGGLVLGNTLLFLPFVLFQRRLCGILPHLGQDIQTLGDLLIWRDHIDVLRAHAEWVGLVTLWVLWPQKRWPRLRRVYRLLSVGIFSFMLLYQTYAGAMWGIYHNAPNVYNDVPFILGGMRFLVDAFHPPLRYYLLVGGALLATLALTGGILYLMFWHIPPNALGRGTRAFLLALNALSVGQGVMYGTWLADPRWAVHSFTADLIDNLQVSLRSRRATVDLLQINPYTLHNYSDYTLEAHPNIYLIFVESYGSILYSDPFYREQYKSTMQNLEAHLTEQGWHMVSSLSVSPTWGGGSWLAYTSAMFGLRVPEHAQYLALRRKYQVLPYPNLGRFLHSKGYDYIWVVPITRKLSAEETEENRRFYGPDQWITFDDLDYHGPLYGWGPSPPDQYTLGYIQDLAQRHATPLFLFFLTQNSHYPWVPLPPVVKNWRSLAHMNIQGGTQKAEETQRLSFTQLRENYLRAIVYDLNMLGDFIQSLKDENALVILIGDHQPPAVSGRDDGYATPIHVLSRDPRWLIEFQRRGFQEGLWLEHPHTTMAHEDLYETIVMDLVKREDKR